MNRVDSISICRALSTFENIEAYAAYARRDLQALGENGNITPQAIQNGSHHISGGIGLLVKIRQLVDAYDKKHPGLLADTQLVHAFTTGDIDNIKDAIEHGANLLVETRDICAFFKLHNRLALLQPLLDAGLDINTKSSRGITMFFYTACCLPVDKLTEHQRERLVGSLHGLQKLGADIDIPDAEGVTALMCVAACPERLFILKALLEMGAAVDAQDSGDNQPKRIKLPEQKEEE